MSFETPIVPSDLQKQEQREAFEKDIKERAEKLGISPDDYRQTYAKNEKETREEQDEDMGNGAPFELDHPAGKYLDNALHVSTRQSLQMEQQQSRIDQLQLDTLTGLYSLRAYTEKLEKLAKSAEDNSKRRRFSDQETEQKPDQYNIIYLDIDHFKNVNDTYGHPKGDDVIQAVAQVIKDSIRREDFAARIGGEELSIIVPGDVSAAVSVSERIRKSVEKHPFDSNGNPFHVTVSLGVASFIANPQKHRLIADAALQIAKGNKKAFLEAEKSSGIPSSFRDGEVIPQEEESSRNQTWIFNDGVFSKVDASQ